MTAHPAGFVESEQRVWYGREIEGAFKRLSLPTAIVNAVPDDHELHTLWDRIMRREVAHVFVTERFNDWEWLERVIVPLMRELTHGVTVAVDGADTERHARILDLASAPALALIVRVPQSQPWAALLRSQDQVSIQLAPYHYMSFTVSSADITVPADYKLDEVPTP